jgi:hypothetical protein
MPAITDAAALGANATPSVSREDQKRRPPLKAVE